MARPKSGAIRGKNVGLLFQFIYRRSRCWKGLVLWSLTPKIWILAFIRGVGILLGRRMGKEFGGSLDFRILMITFNLQDFL